MASKTEKKSRSKAKTSAKKNDSLWGWLIAAGVIALIALPIVINSIRSSNLPGEGFSSQGNAHITLGDAHPEYNSNPPTSGWHTGNLTSWGSYDYVVPEETVIHNMEDGGVILWYQLGSVEENAAHIALLEEVAKGYRRVVIMPREGMETKYAMTAWQRLQTFDDIDEEAMRAFLEAFEGVDHHNG